MNSLLDLIARVVLLPLLQALVWLMRVLPLRLTTGFMYLVLRGLFILAPRHRRVALDNLAAAFPEASKAWRIQTYQECLWSLARVFVDFARLPVLTPAWVESQVECSFLARYRELKAAHPGMGVLIATGHLGSFELLAHCMPMWGHPLAFVVRNFKLESIDAWWTASRERWGNKVIKRRGAFKEVFKRLSSGQDVAILFDQNVTKNHATFVPWFGKLAATTKTPALAALRTGCPVVVAGIVSLPGDRYQVLAEECPINHIRDDPSLTSEEKVERITALLSARYEAFIRSQPGSWFWFHRRWRTRPDHERATGELPAGERPNAQQDAQEVRNA